MSDSASSIGPSPVRLTTRAAADEHIFFWYVFLAVFHVPLVTVGKEVIGLYDVATVLLPLYMLMRRRFRGGTLFGFAKTFGITWLAYLCFIGMRIGLTPDDYVVLLAIKHIQYAVSFAILAQLVQSIRSHKFLVESIGLVFLILSLFQLASFFNLTSMVGIPRGFGYGLWYRVGLPFMLGVSSNPAGFVLGAFLIFWWYQRETSARFRLFVGVLVAAAFFLTFSRTNLAALALTVFVFALPALLARPLRLVVLVAGGFFLVLLLISVLDTGFASEGVQSRLSLLSALLNPERLLSDRSFSLRYLEHWPRAIHAWLESPWSILFGKQFGGIQVVDGTVPRLLANQGVVGLSLFALVWFYWPAKLSKWSTPTLALMCFAAVNGIAGETLITSFRSVQAYVPLLLLMVTLSYADGRIPDNRPGRNRTSLLWRPAIERPNSDQRT